MNEDELFPGGTGDTTAGLDWSVLQKQLAAEKERLDDAFSPSFPQADPSDRAPRYRIRVVHLGGKVGTEEYLFDKARVSFGRSEENDVVLPSPSGILSRRHFEIQYEDRAYWLVDVNSRNGTSMQGRVLDPSERYVLLDGDSFDVGEFRVTFLGRVV